MIGNWEIITLFLGFVLEYILYSKYHFRAGGVIVLPILAIYFVLYPFYVPILLLISIINFFILEFLYSKYIVYGRRLMYLSLVIGIVLSLIPLIYFQESLGMFGGLTPGLLAYNAHREKHSTVLKVKSLVLNTLVFGFLVIITFFSLILVV